MVSLDGRSQFGHFTMDDLQDIGVDFALALVDFTSIENCVSCLDVLRQGTILDSAWWARASSLLMSVC